MPEIYQTSMTGTLCSANELPSSVVAKTLPSPRITAKSDTWHTRLPRRLQSCRSIRLTVTIDDLHRCREQNLCRVMNA